MNNLAIDQTTGDLIETGNQINQVTGLDAVAQSIYSDLKMFLGEFWLNRTLGVPYYEVLFKKNIDLSIKKTILKNEILKNTNVIEVTKFESEFSAGERSLTIIFSAQTTEGLIEDLEVAV